MKVNIAVLFISLFYLLSGIIAQVPKNKNNRLRQDFTIFRKTFENDYPSLYRYTGEAKMNALFDSCFASINQNTTNIKFYAMLKFILSTIKDGHLYCSMPPDVDTYIGNKAKFFPLDLRFIKDHAYVVNSVNNEVQAGAEVISINDLPIKIIKGEILKYIVSDGNIQTKKEQILDYVFYFYYYLKFGEKATFNVRLKSKNGRIKNEHIKALPESNFVRNSNETESKELLQFSTHPNNIGVLTIKTFDQSRLKENHEYFIKFLGTTFKKMHDQKIDKLIIDLRGNGGGRDLYGSLLYSYLTNKPFHYYKSLITATKDLPFDKFIKKSSSFNDLNADMLLKISKNRFRLKKVAHSNLKIISPSRYNYTGRIWFLTNGSSFSTTAEFCAIARSNERGKFIGEETGGAYYGNTSGEIKEITLPNTKVKISFGLVAYEMDVKKAKYKGRGVIPDYEVQPKNYDILSNRDTQMNYALKLANSNRQNKQR